MTEKFQEIQLCLPIQDDILTQKIHREPLADSKSVKENSLRPGIDPRDPQVFELMREGVRPCDIIVIWPGQ